MRSQVFETKYGISRSKSSKVDLTNNTLKTIIYKLRSVQNTGTCYLGQGWFFRNLG